MLDGFVMSRIHYKMHLRLYVDCLRNEAQATITYEDVIKEIRDVPYLEVRTPDLAEAYLRRPTGQHTSMVEHLEWLGRYGLLEKVAEAA